MAVSPPTLFWYQLYGGVYVPEYYHQLDTCVRSLCSTYSVTPPTAQWYNQTLGSSNSLWSQQIDTAIRALCVIFGFPPPTEPINNQTVGQLFAKYNADLDATTRSLCNGGAIFGPVAPLTNPYPPLDNFNSLPSGVTGLVGYYDLYVRDSDKAMFVSTQQRGSLMQFDASDPTNITYVGESARFPVVNGKGNRVISVLDSTHLVVSNDQSAVIIYDISTSPPTQSGILNDATNLGSCLSVRVVGTTGFAVCNNGKITSLNLGGTNPVVIQSVLNASILATPVNIEIAGNYAVVASTSGTLGNISTWSIANPAAMTLVDNKPCNIAEGLCVVGNTIYVTSYDLTGKFPSTNHAFQTYTIDPATGLLTLISSQSGFPAANRMIKIGNYLWGTGTPGTFAASPGIFEASGLFAVDISTSLSPVLAYVGPQYQSEARALYNISGESVLYEAEDTGAKLHTFTISPIS